MAKLWQKKGYQVEELIEQFTVGNDRELDLALAKYDILGNKAHAAMLQHTGILSKEELQGTHQVLDQLLKQVEAGEFQIEEGFEDVHSKVEFALTEQLGETGKRIHTGRSRNDQVLLDMHLYLRAEIQEIKEEVRGLSESLLQQAEEYKDCLLPGYTHLQVAMPSSFGLWFSAYAEALIDDVYFLNAAYQVADQNPLGSAAGYGTSIPLNRSMTTELLGFDTLKYNTVAAQMSRGKAEKSLSLALSSVGGTVAKMAMDVCLYMSQNFGFFSLPPELTTGSSIMPHKKNPDVFEVMRGKCNKVQSLPYELTLLTNNLPSGYHRDFQLLKESLMPAIASIKECLKIAKYVIPQLKVNQEAINAPIYDYLYTVEVVNEEVMKGKSFREAYQTVGESVENGTYQPRKSVDHCHEGSIGNLCLNEIREKLERAMAQLNATPAR